jgi:hypothetical protein
VRQRRGPSSDVSLAAGTLGTAGGFVVIRTAQGTGYGYRELVLAGASGEVEWRLRRGDTTVAQWSSGALERPRSIVIPGGCVLEVRRPAAVVGIAGAVVVTVAEAELGEEAA